MLSSSKEVTKFVHINLAHTKVANIMLSQDMVHNGYVMASVNEPYTFENKLVGFSNDFQIFANSEEPRAAIITYGKVDPFLLFCTRDIVLISCVIYGFKLLFCSVYCSPSEDIEGNLLVLSGLMQKYISDSIIICGDFNAKSTIWGQRPTDDRGDLLINFVNAYNLAIENDPNSIPTYQTTKGESWIDIIITNNINRSKFDMEVLDTFVESDHNIIVLKWYSESKKYTYPLKIKMDRMNWIDLKIDLYNIVDKFRDLEDWECSPEHKIEEIQRIIYDSCIKNMNRKRKNKNNKIWWNREIAIERNKTRALRRLFQKERDSDARIIKRQNYKLQLARYKKKILQIKRDSFKHYLDTIVVTNKFNRPYSVIMDKIRKPLQLQRIVKEDGNLADNYADAYYSIIKFNFPHNGINENWEKEETSDYHDIVLNEVLMILNEMKLNKAPGIDEIPLDIIRELYNTNCLWFTGVLNLCYQNGLFPSVWKKAKVVLIPKENKNLTLNELISAYMFITDMG